MANLINNPVYITAQDVRDTTNASPNPNAALAALTDEQLEYLITQAQCIIDDYIRCYGTPFVEGQDFIFPIDVDGVSTIADDIKKATFYIVQNLFGLGNSVIAGGGNITEERRTEHSVKYSDNQGSDIDTLIPTIAIQILDGYANRFIKQTLTNA